MQRGGEGRQRPTRTVAEDMDRSVAAPVLDRLEGVRERPCDGIVESEVGIEPRGLAPAEQREVEPALEEPADDTPLRLEIEDDGAVDDCQDQEKRTPEPVRCHRLVVPEGDLGLRRHGFRRRPGDRNTHAVGQRPG